METAAFNYREGVEAEFLNHVKENTNVHKGEQRLDCLLEAQHVTYCWLVHLYAKQKSLNM